MTAHDSHTLRTARLPGWLVLIPGLAGILLGLLLLGSPERGLSSAAQILGLYWFVFGALAAFALASQAGQVLWKMVSGGLSLLAGLLALLDLLAGGFLTEPVLAVLIGLAGALIGLLGLVQSWRGEGIVSAVLGGLNLLLGLLLLFQPQVGGWPLAWLLGGLLLFGSLLAMFAALARSLLGGSYAPAARPLAVTAAPAPLAAAKSGALETAAAAPAWNQPPRYEPPPYPSEAEQEEDRSLLFSQEIKNAFERMQDEDQPAEPPGTPPSGEDTGELEELPELELPSEARFGADAELESPAELPPGVAALLEDLPALEETEAEAWLATEEVTVQALPGLDVHADAELEAPPGLEEVAPAPQLEDLPPAPEAAAVQPPPAPSPEAAAQAELMTKFRFPLEFVEGIGPAYAAALKSAGLTTCLDLLKAGTTPGGRQHISRTSGLPPALIMKWVNHVDLFRVRGIGSEYADLLEIAGVDTVAELAQRNPSHLYAALIEVYNEKHPVRQMPTQAQVADWVARAKRLPKAVEY